MMRGPFSFGRKSAPANVPRPIVDEGEETNADTFVAVSCTHVIMTIVNHNDATRWIEVYMTLPEARAYVARLRNDPPMETSYGPRVLVQHTCSCGCGNYFSGLYTREGAGVIADQADEAITVLEAQ